jgi:hypothetical protein
MLTLIIHFLRSRRERVILVIASATMTAAAFALFISASSATTLTTDQSLSQYWRTTYDILVRAPASVTDIERQYGLVRANHLSGTAGGITLAQWEQIKSIPGVEVAAPIAMLGYLPRNPVLIGIQDDLPIGIYDVSATVTITDGERVLTYSRPAYYTSYDFDITSLYSTDPEMEAQFSKHALDLGIVLSGQNASTGWWGFPILTPSFNDKLLIAAIDPEQEAKLVHLDQMLASGNYLKSGLPFMYPEHHSDIPLIPALLNREDYIKESISIHIDQVGDLPPQKGWVDWLLAIPNKQALDTAVRKPVWEANFPMHREWVDSSNFIVVKDGQEKTRSSGVFPEIMGPLSMPAPVAYRVMPDPPDGLPDDRLVLEAVPVGLTSSQIVPETAGFLSEQEYEQIEADLWRQPPEVTYRSLQPRLDANIRFWPAVQGSFEIDLLKALGGASINQVPLETYLAPLAQLRYTESGQPVDPPVQLSPTLNKEGYLASPPDMLIPLDQVSHLFENGCWVQTGEATSFTMKKTSCGSITPDLISAVRVRVGGIDTLTPAAQAKIELVAQAIAEQTGLHVDIMVGSSPQPVLVHLPGFGDVPARGYIEELWIKKGVNTLVSMGMNRADRLLFGTMLFVCLLFLFNANLISNLGRLPEFGVMKALGWRQSTLFRLLCGESLMLGLASGLLSALAATAIVRVFSLSVSLNRIALLVPLGAGAFLLGALLPAVWAAWVSPTLAIQAGETSQKESFSRITGGSLFGYAAGGLLRRPARLLITLSGLILASGLLVLLKLVQDGQEGQLYGTLLGAWIRTQVQPYHLLMGGVALLAAALGVGELMVMNVIERRKEIGLLVALGWRRGDLLGVFLLQGAFIGLVGGMLGVLLAGGLYRVAYGPLPAAAATWLGVVGVGIALPVAIVILAALYPASHAARLLPLEAFRGEERLEASGLVNSTMSGLGLAGAFCLVLIVGAFLAYTHQPAPVAPPVAVLSTPSPTPTLQPLKPWVEPTPISIQGLPSYKLDLDGNTDQNLVVGSGEIRLVNDTGETLDSLALRLYPNYPVLGENKNLIDLPGEILVNQQPVTVSKTLFDSLALLHLDQPLQPGEQARIAFGLKLEIPSFGNLPEDVWVLRSPIPLLGIRENGAWRQDTCSYCPDIVYSQAANFQISLTLPPDWLVASNLDQTGVLGTENKNAPLTHILSSHNVPVRDTALVMSPRLHEDIRTFGEVEVKVYTLQEEAGVDDAMIEQIFSTAEESLHLFSERFGPYPYRALNLVIFPGVGTSGEEYPGLAFLYLKKDAKNLPSVVAHEIAHQWWYGAVGSDIYREPWLDESLAEYSAMLYLEQDAGLNVAQTRLEEYRNDVQVLSLSTGKDWKVGSSVLDFPDFDAYETVVYRKGPLFLDALRQEIGDEAFFSGLQQYYEWYKFGIGTGQGFLEAMQQASGKDLRPLFDEWVGLDNLR